MYTINKDLISDTVKIQNEGSKKDYLQIKLIMYVKYANSLMYRCLPYIWDPGIISCSITFGMFSLFCQSLNAFRIHLISFK